MRLSLRKEIVSKISHQEERRGHGIGKYEGLAGREGPKKEKEGDGLVEYLLISMVYDYLDKKDYGYTVSVMKPEIN